MYFRLEEAGLINGTQKWKDKQDNKIINLLREVAEEFVRGKEQRDDNRENKDV